MFSWVFEKMAKYKLKVNPQKTEITTLTPTSLDNITKKLGTYLSMDKKIFPKKTLTLVAINTKKPQIFIMFGNE